MRTGAPQRAIVEMGFVDWYRLPSWYDVLHASGTAQEVDGLEAIAGRWCACSWKGASRWLEPACGTGRYLRCAARRGVRVEGFDSEPAMVRYARERFARAGLQGTLHESTFTDFPLPARRAHLGFCLINSLRHARSDEEVLLHLERMGNALTRGGVYAVGLNVSAPGTEMPSEDVWSGARGLCRVTQLVQYLPPEPGERTERVFSHLTVATPAREIHLDTQYSLRTYSGADWRALLDRSAMRLLAITDERGHEVGDIDDDVWTGERASRYGVWLLTPR